MTPKKCKGVQDTAKHVVGVYLTLRFKVSVVVYLLTGGYFLSDGGTRGTH